MNDNQIFAVYLEDHLKRNGSNQAQFAAKLGISAQYLTDMKKGSRSPSDTVLEGMAEHLDCDRDEAYWVAGRITPDLEKLVWEIGPQQWKKLRKHYTGTEN